MRDRYNMLMNEYFWRIHNIKMWIGKEFKKACRYFGIKDKTLHNHRATYAVIRWAITVDIKMVAVAI